MSASHESLEAQALQYVGHPRFSHTVRLPASSNHAEDLIVGYADLGRVPDADSAEPAPPTVLFIPGMFASRYLGVAMHVVAEKLGVRILVVERPGMGKSTEVPLDKRVAVWVELVPRLLEHLGISHVSLVSHSAGAVFLFNTLVHCRDILYPTNPFVALLAPWADPDNSKVTSMRAAQFVPVAAFQVWHLIPKFFLRASPALASSGTVFNMATKALQGASRPGELSEMEKSRKKVEEVYGMDQGLQVQIEKQVFRSMFAENTVGANDEALQCLRKGNYSWGACNHYGEFTKGVVARERYRKSAAASDQEYPRLKIRAYFAESDSLVGVKGREYMVACWTQEALGDTSDVLDFESSTVPNTDHDTVMQLIDVMEKVLMDAGGAFET